MVRQSRFLQAISLVVPVLAFGCGEAGPDRPETFAVTGVVTHKGLPVPDAQVTFSPEGQGQAAFGRTDAEGRYTLTTFESGDGATVGRYKVAVTKYSTVDQPVVPTGDAYVPPEGRRGQKVAKPKSLLPAKYASPQTTDLQAEVKAEETTYDITLAG